MKKLLLIDAHALIHRSYHALPPLTTPDGRPIGAIYGLTRALLKTLKEQKPDFVAAAFDRPEPTFRKEMYEEYKAHRPKAADELVSQLIASRELFEKLNIKTFEVPGYEGDDIIGTLAEQFGKEKGLHITILTGDMDTLQLVKDDRVVVMAPKKGISETIIYNADAVRERYELNPEQMTDYKGLVGDPSDNIPGVPGVGPKTAVQALKEFGSIENLYASMKDDHKLAKKLLAFKKDAFFSKKLATIHTEVPVRTTLSELEYKTADEHALQKYFSSLGFDSLVRARSTSQHAPSVTTPSVNTEEYEVFLDKEDLKEEKFGGDKIKTAYDWKALIKDSPKSLDLLKAPLFDMHVASWLLSPDEKDVDIEHLAEHWAHINIVTHPEKTRDALAVVSSQLDTEIKKHALEKVFYEIEIPLIPALARMELLGILINKKELLSLGQEMEHEVRDLEQRIYTSAGKTFNINSPQQLGEVLFETLGLQQETKRKTSTGQRKTGKDVLQELSDAHPIVPLILQYRETFKAYSSFLEPLSAASEADGRIHTTYLQTGTGTGRLSSEKPNLQNIPQGSRWAKRIRDTFEASAGYTLVSIDYSQLELRLLAHVTHEPALMSAFMAHEDVHAITASKIFGIAPESVDPKQRRIGKTLNFGIIYGMGPRLLSKTAGVTNQEASKFIADYFAAFPAVRSWQEEVKTKMKKDGFVMNENGRKRWFNKDSAPGEFERAAINMPLQGLGADILKLAMTASDRELAALTNREDARLLLSIHDELLFEIRDDLVKTLAPRLKNLMESAYPLDVPLITEMKTGKKWGTMSSHG